METAYCGLMNLLTHAPEDWDQVVKEEPLSPGSFDSSPSHQHTDSQPTGLPYTFHNSMVPAKSDPSLDALMALEKESFVSVDEDFMERLLRDEGDPFQFKAERHFYKDCRRQIIKTPNPYYLPECTPRDFNLPSLTSYHKQSSSSNSSCASSTAVSPLYWNQSGSHDEKSSKSLQQPINLSSSHAHDKASPTQKMKSRRIKHTKKYGHILWKFILELLMKVEYKHVICWTGNKLIFKIVNKNLLSQLWSEAKVRQHNVKISYESITRALRSYKPKGCGSDGEVRPAIVSHYPESNFTYYFDEYYHQEISKEANTSFDELLTFARSNGLSTYV